MWNWFRKRGAKPEKKMTISRARELVGAFADLFQTGADGHGPLIGDASELPCSRRELIEAFQTYIEAAHITPAMFPDNAEASARVMARAVDDFFDIDPADQDEVRQINEKAELTLRAMQLMEKYRRRALGSEVD